MMPARHSAGDEIRFKCYRADQWEIKSILGAIEPIDGR